MLLAGNKEIPTVVYLSLRGFTASKGQRILKSHICGETEDSLDALQKWLLAAPVRGVVNIFLSAALCRPFMAQVPKELSPTEAELAWSAAASLYTGLTQACEVWRENGTFDAKQVAAAVSSSLLSTLKELPRLTNQKISIASIQPAWAEWLSIALSKDPKVSCVALHEPDSVSVISGEGGRFEAANFVLQGEDVVATGAAVSRLLLISNVGEAPPMQARLDPLRTTPILKTASLLGILLESLP